MAVRLDNFVESVQGKVLNGNPEFEEISLTGAYVSDLLSDVMGNAKENQVWITIMKHLNVVAVAALANMPCVCFANSVMPDEAVIKKAIDEGICLISSPLSTFEIAGKLYLLLNA
jgi:hypothetical protein